MKKAPFVVLIGANMPSVLSEISFVSNPNDERLLRKPDQRQRIADGLYRGISAYLENLTALHRISKSWFPITTPLGSSRSGTSDIRRESQLKYSASNTVAIFLRVIMRRLIWLPLVRWYSQGCPLSHKGFCRRPPQDGRREVPLRTQAQ